MKILSWDGRMEPKRAAYASSGVHEQALGDTVPRNDTVACESGWIERLCGLFPDTPVKKVRNTVHQSVSLEEAADQLLCEAQEGKQEKKHSFQKVFKKP